MYYDMMLYVTKKVLINKSESIECDRKVGL